MAVEAVAVATEVVPVLYLVEAVDAAAAAAAVVVVVPAVAVPAVLVKPQVKEILSQLVRFLEQWLRIQRSQRGFLQQSVSPMMGTHGGGGGSGGGRRKRRSNSNTVGPAYKKLAYSESPL